MLYNEKVRKIERKIKNMKTQRLLVVDDNLSLIHMIREHAKNSGKMEVLYEAHDGEEGFRMIKNHANEIDLVLLDLIMPNKHGIYLLDKLKEEEINAAYKKGKDEGRIEGMLAYQKRLIENLQRDNASLNQKLQEIKK